MEMARFAEPIDTFALEDWQGSEIYRNEEYLEMENGDLVLNDLDPKMDWMHAHGILKTAGEETE